MMPKTRNISVEALSFKGLHVSIFSEGKGVNVSIISEPPSYQNQAGKLIGFRHCK